MPTPSRTSLDEIVASGRELIEADGLRSLTMNRVAGMVGVRAPSLYKHVANRADLVRLIAEDVIGELLHRLEHAVTDEDPRADLEALAHSFRSFAKEAPGAYQLVFQSLPADARPDPDGLTGIDAPRDDRRQIAGPDLYFVVVRGVVIGGHGAPPGLGAFECLAGGRVRAARCAAGRCRSSSSTTRGATRRRGPPTRPGPGSPPPAHLALRVLGDADAGPF